MHHAAMANKKDMMFALARLGCDWRARADGIDGATATYVLCGQHGKTTRQQARWRGTPGVLCAGGRGGGGGRGCCCAALLWPGLAWPALLCPGARLQALLVLALFPSNSLLFLSYHFVPPHRNCWTPS